MTRDEVVLFLTYVQMFDNRPLTHEIIDAWTGLRTVQMADLSTAKAAVEVFFNEPAVGPTDRTWFDSRHFTRCVRIVKRQREVEAAKERAKQFAITARPAGPRVPWRELRDQMVAEQAPPRVTEKPPTASMPTITTGMIPQVRRDMNAFVEGFGKLA